MFGLGFILGLAVGVAGAIFLHSIGVWGKRQIEGKDSADKT